MKLRARLLALTVGLLVPLSALVVVAERQVQTAAAIGALRAHVDARLAGDGAQRCEDDPARFSSERSRRPPPDEPPPFFGDAFDGGGPPPHDHGDPPDGGRAPREERHHEGPPRRGSSSRDGHEGGGPRPSSRPSPPPGHVSVYVYDEAGRSPSPEAPPLPAEIRAPHARPLERAYKVDHGRGQELVQRVPNAGPHCAFLLARRAAPPLRLDVVRPWVPPVFVLTAAVFIGLIPVVRRIRRLSAAVRASAGTGYADVVAVEGDDEIGELSQAFRDAGREVRARIETQEAREQTLRDFLANTTHDVMTPLTALHGHLIAFREAAAQGKPPDERAISAAIDEAHYMTSLLHNLGVAARIEAGEPHLVRAPIDLGRLVERVASRHRIIANQHDVSLEHAVPERPLLVSGDETFLEQAVSNFVYNAIRYNRPGGHVAVIVETVEPTRFRLRVLDDGPGVPSSKVEQLAARNVRGESARTRHPDGQGLGLAIAAKVAAIHDFSLRFSNPDEGGLEVTLEGPLPAPELP